MSIVAETATLAHGYTMGRLQAVARRAVATYSRGGVGVLGYDERFEVAWLAVVEHLYTAEERPEVYQLSHAAWNALAIAANDWYRHRGINPKTLEERTSFTRYWGPVRAGHPDFSDSLVERLALPQVLATLSATDYETLAALAAHGCNAAAAAAVGCNEVAFKARVGRARENAIAAWLAPESAPRIDLKVTCKRGHRWSEHGAPLGRNGGMVCRKCKNDRAREGMRRRRQLEVA